MDEEMRLIRAIQKTGDRIAADALISAYFDEIFAYAVKQTADRHTAMDLTQNIFISMLGSIARYDSKRASFRTWLYRIATNKIIDHHRSKSAIQNKILNIDVPDEFDFTRQMTNKDLAARIQAYVGTFEAESQRIFRLKIFGEYTFAEISKMVDMPEATVKTKYYRMLKILRKEFGDEYYS